MYDIHCHILPGVDGDGPQGLEDALAMARMAVNDGTRVVVATPHGARVAELGGKGALAQRVQAFNDELRVRAIELTVVMGVEYLLSMELLEEARHGAPITLNGSHYLLVEIDHVQYPPYTEEALFQLQLAGFTPVLAHPERQAVIQEHPELLAGLVGRGILSQVTGASILGSLGRPPQKSAEQLLKSNLVHLIASDGHSATEDRAPVMAEAVEAAGRLVGEEVAHTLGVVNPSAIVADVPVTLPVVRLARRRLLPWLGR